MFSSLRPRSVYDVLAVIGCFAALTTGGAYAANEWGGANIVDESLTGADVRGKNGAGTTQGVNGSLKTEDIFGQPAVAASGQLYIDGTLTTWDLRDNSTYGRDINDDTLTGADIRESTLGKVPAAATADAIAEPEDWHYIGAPGEPEFLNDWVNADGHNSDAAFYEDGESRVHLKGTIKDGVVGATAFIIPRDICQEPTGPPGSENEFADERHPVATFSGYGELLLINDPSGTVVIPVSGSNALFGLNGVSYRSCP
jgi:hypothetical protein